MSFFLGSVKDRVQLSMPQIQNATLAGGTAMSTTAQGSMNHNRTQPKMINQGLNHGKTENLKSWPDSDRSICVAGSSWIPSKASMPVHPGGALLIGFIGGIVSTLGFRYSQVLKKT